MEYSKGQKDVIVPETLADTRFLIFVHKKTERMTTALYLITDLLQDTEPLKWSLRDKGLVVLGLMSPVAHGKRFQDRARNHIGPALREIETLIILGRSSRLISEMNSDVLQRACRELHELVSSADPDQPLQEEFFAVEEPQKPAVMPKIAIQQQSPQRPKPVQNTDRRARILEVLKKGGEFNLKDISRHISGVSEKTIQRDLVSLVSEDILQRQGSRRWTTYKIK